MEYPSDVEIVQALRKRIKELEDGACRFNCRTVKEAYMDGYQDGFSEGFHCEDNPGLPLECEAAYREWKAK